MAHFNQKRHFSICISYIPCLNPTEVAKIAFFVKMAKNTSK